MHCLASCMVTTTHSTNKKEQKENCSSQKLILIKMLTCVHATESLPSWCPQLSGGPDASVTPHPLRIYFRPHLSQHTKDISFPTSSATQSHPGIISYSENITLRSRQNSKILNFTLKVPSSDHRDLCLQLCYLSSPMLKSVTPLHWKWAVMDNEEIPCMQSQ